ncbi:DUF1028 domain-containing protein [Pseudogracilibacillus auburnensis]|uniref:Putative Ntn-hydrolase superfamily protein n=1 Tax=Pseudogracilibacillus auburnensis TaxID=1494959 RepID=A0A2V3VZM3_9BACI|nr:DUF1028 domain-containing protein [Pseudogracilibacillus auburnensis]MBO1002362.1 DUF1028 domain-containing protein [Pseudogracilibacillus auburnensis]PXW86248.1 putative Ntn-hydrolase superfamily protein [Pseudogracilibacillus auburnensis]
MTFSITARCKKTGMLGIAVSTARPAVGGLAVYVKANVGAIATQAALNPYFGIDGLKYLEQGMTAEQVMERVKREDAEYEKRQLAIVDNEGRTAGYTGNDTVPWAGHYFGDQFVVAGNMLVGEEVVKVMAETYENSNLDYLPERLLEALHAGQNAGGDKRGRQSAALHVVDKLDYAIVNIRADEHPNPVQELERIYDVCKTDLFPYIDKLPVYKNR